MKDFKQFERDIIWNALDSFVIKIIRAKELGKSVSFVVTDKDGINCTAKEYEKEDLQQLLDKVSKLRGIFA